MMKSLSCAKPSVSSFALPRLKSIQHWCRLFVVGHQCGSGHIRKRSSEWRSSVSSSRHLNVALHACRRTTRSLQINARCCGGIWLSFTMRPSTPWSMLVAEACVVLWERFSTDMTMQHPPAVCMLAFCCMIFAGLMPVMLCVVAVRGLGSDGMGRSYAWAPRLLFERACSVRLV